MIIAGNSHVILFKEGLILPNRNNEEIKIHWVGPITIDDFIEKKATTEKIKTLFKKENDWKFLSIGNHDVKSIIQLLEKGEKKESLLLSLKSKYEEVFKELNISGKFSWMITLQQLKTITSNNFNEQEVLGLAKEFNIMITELCNNLKIPVINPLAEILGENKVIEESFLDEEKMHFSPKALPYYLKQLKEVIQEDIESKYLLKLPTLSNTLFVDIEAFFSLLFETIGIPEKKLVKINSLEAKVVNFVSEILNDKGITLSLNLDTEIVNSGLLNSLELVELYTFISEETGKKIDFKIDIKEFSNLKSILGFVLKEEDTLTQEDFFNSLKLNFELEKELILTSEEKIARINNYFYEKLLSVLSKIPEKAIKYGIFYHWLALIQANKNNYKEAIKLSKKAQDKNLEFPIKDSRTSYYQKVWLKNYTI